MKALVARLSDKQLAAMVNEYWSVAGILGHIAFWDGRALFLAGSVRGMACCSPQVSGSGVCMAGGRAGLSPRDLAPRPGAPEVDCPTWSRVLGPCLLEVVQHVLRAVSRPDCKKAVIVVLEAAAATHGDEPPIPDFGEDHQFAISLLCPPSPALPSEYSRIRVAIASL